MHNIAAWIYFLNLFFQESFMHSSRYGIVFCAGMLLSCGNQQGRENNAPWIAENSSDVVVGYMVDKHQSCPEIYRGRGLVGEKVKSQNRLCLYNARRSFATTTG
jgi:hypothetical protein